MKYQVKAGPIDKIRSSCVVCPAFSGKTLNPTALALDKLTEGAITRATKQAAFLSEVGQTLILYPDSGAMDRVVLLGLGKEKALDLDTFTKAITKCWGALGHTTSKEVLFLLSDCVSKKLDAAVLTRHCLVALQDTAYLFEEYKSKKSPPSALKQITYHFTNKKLVSSAEDGVAIGQAVALAKARVRDLGNTPPNVCTPTYLAGQAKKLAKAHSSLKVEILEEAQMKKLGMGALLSVTDASTEPAKLICLQYTPAKPKSDKPIVFVGKGITYDTGGLCLKPKAGMLTMKYDMLGAATVLALLSAVAELGLDIPVVGVMACSENCIGPDATKPDAVIKTMKGLTVEITNTDAEGRLVLADALTYVEKFDPECVIDMATLTGGVIVCLGDIASGVMSNHLPLQKEIEAAAQSSRDLVWPLPVWNCYRDKIVSKVADIKNEAGFPSTVLAGVFLSHFAEAYNWAHLDIAGTAFSGDKLATGRPVHLLVEFLLNKTKKK